MLRRQVFQNRRFCRSGFPGLSKALAAVMVISQAFPLSALANADGGTVVGGVATIAGEGSANVVVTQRSERAIINWDSLSIGLGESLIFNQPGAQAIAANRVIGLNPSEILGTLQANGRVVLVNPNGILFGKGAKVDVAGLIATTHDFDDAGFMDGGALRFDSSGLLDASVVNEGSITVRDAGLAALVAPHVRNTGLITANLGRVALGAGAGFTLDFYGDGLISFAAGDEIAETLTDAEGTPLNALVENSGEINAAGGRILLTAAAARDVVNRSVNIDGVVRADSVRAANGVITLAASGSVHVETDALVSASGAAGGGRIAVDAGGFISDGLILADGASGAEVTGDGGVIDIRAGAAGLGGVVSASGKAGGSIRVETDGLLSLAETVRATGVLGEGGTVSYKADRLMESSTGSTDASGLTHGGVITVTADSQVATSGDYFADGLYGRGGRIDMTADDVRLLSAGLSARGRIEGGLVRVGGAFQGGKTPDPTQPYHDSFVTRWGGTPALANATQTFVNDGARIDVSATGGAGGTAVVWSDQLTTFLGAVDATGGAAGGSVEISAAEDLRRAELANVSVGAGGHLLLDPKNIIIGTTSQVSDWSYAGIIGAGYAGAANTDLGGLEADDLFGISVALNGAGDRLAVGSFSDDGSDNLTSGAGAVHLFSFTDTYFAGGALEATIGKGYTGGKNVDMSALEASDAFGASVSLNAAGDRLAVGARSDDGSGGGAIDSGAAYLFTFTDTSFTGGTLAATIGAGYMGGNNVNVTNLGAGDQFGWSVSLDANGDQLAVGAFGDDGSDNLTSSAGAVYLFTFTDTSFTGGALAATMGKGYTGGGNVDVAALAASDVFGYAVSLNAAGDRLAVGAVEDDGSGNGTSNSGAVYLFSFTNTSFTGGTLAATIGAGYTGSKNIDMTASLAAGDTFGTGVSLNAAGDRLAVGAAADDGSGDTTADSGAVYLFTFTDNSFSNGQLIATMGQGYTVFRDVDVSALDSGDNFGRSVSLNAAGDRLAVGALRDDGLGNVVANSGAAYLFSFTDTSFSGGTQRAIIGSGYTAGKNLDVTALRNDDTFGGAVALNAAGNRLAVGASGDDGFNDTFSNTGAVYLFSFTDNSFAGGAVTATIGKGYTGGKNVDVSALESSDRFGTSVSLNAAGDRLAVGATGDEGSGNTTSTSGAVYLFSFTDSSFANGALAATIGAGYTGSNDIDVALDPFDRFGGSVSLNAAGDRLAVGAALDRGPDNSSPIGSGAVYLFSFTDTSGSFTGGTLAATIGAGYTGSNDIDMGTFDMLDRFGGSVSLNAAGDRLAVGALGDSGPDNSVNFAGAVHLFTFTDNSFAGGTLAGTMGSGYTGGKNVDVSALEASDGFGGSVSLNAAGDRLAVGASGDDGFNNTLAGSGAVYLFAFADTSFTNSTLAGTIGKGYTGGANVDVSALESGDGFGGSVSLNATGDSLAVGAFSDDGSGRATDGSGAVHLFTGAKASVADADSYSDSPTDTITVGAAEIVDILDDGTAVTLQASNDLTVSQAITVTGTPGSIGALTLQAGRSILVDADITTTVGGVSGAVSLFANDTLANGVIDGQRDAGAAAITMAAGTHINAGTAAVAIELRDGAGKTNTASGDITLEDITGGTISAVNSGPTAGSGIVLNSGAVLTASATSGTSIELAGDGFINNAGAGALATAGSGRFLVWSSDPAADNRGGLVHDFKQYNATRGVTAAAGGAAEDGFLYSIAPSITPSLTGSIAKTYDTTTTANLAAGNYSVSGAIDGDTVTLNSPTSGSYDTKNAGSGKTVTASGISMASATNGAVTVFGYQMATTSANAAIGSISAASLTLTGVSASDKVYDATTTATVSGGTLAGVLGGDTVTLNSGSASGAFADKNVGTDKVVTVSGYTLSGTDAGNYTLTQPTGLTADITAASLTITGVSASDKVYDATTAASLSGGTLAGVLGGDTVTLNSGSASGAFADKNVGTDKAVTVSGYTLSGTDAGNYILTQQPTGLTADITAASLTITGVSAADKVYDATATASLSGGALAGVLGGDTVTLNSGSASGAFADKNVGTDKAVTASGYTLSGTDVGNYTLIQPTGLTADITPAMLTAGLTGNVDKTFDGTTAATLAADNYLLPGVLGNDTVTLNNATTGSYDDANLGTGKTVTVTGLELAGADAGNYLLTATSASGAIGAITPVMVGPWSLTPVSTINDNLVRIPPFAACHAGGANAGQCNGEETEYSPTISIADDEEDDNVNLSTEGGTYYIGSGL